MEGKHRLQSKVEGAKEQDSSSRRSKRDSKQVTERPSTRNTDGTQDVAVWHSKRRRENQDPEPVEFPLQETVSKSDHETEKKGSDPKLSNSSKPGHISNAGSYFQHDDRSAVPNSRNVRRRPYSDHGRWNDSTKGQPTDHYKDRVHYADVRGRENRGQVLTKVEGGDRVWCHDRFFELEANEPQEKRKPAFRETKVVSRVVSTAGTAVIVNDDEDGTNEVADNIRREARVDGSEQQHQIEKGSEKDSEVGRKDRDRGYVQRKDLDRGRWLERDGYNDRFQYRGRFSNISRGREKMGRRFDSGVRNQFRSHTSTGEKWKHDLFDETNQSPPPKNEEEQIAKIEMLLSG